MAKILVVDDEPQILPLMSTLLTRAGHTVITATSGNEALTVAMRELPDLVMTDQLMPGMNGDELIRQLRSNSAAKYVSAIIMTRFSGHSRPNFDGLTLVAVLQKPIEIKEILASVGKALAHP